MPNARSGRSCRPPSLRLLQLHPYEEMLSRKYYDYYELAAYNQDGEALEMQYGDEEKTVFAVQGHELSKLHIYAADDSDEFGLIKAKSEQEALERSVLDAEVEL